MRIVLVSLLFLVGSIVATLYVKNVKLETNLMSSNYDVVIFINDQASGLTGVYAPFQTAFTQYNVINSKLGSRLEVVPFLAHPARKMIFAPTGSLREDYTDSRQLSNAAKQAFELMHEQGLRKPLLVLGPFQTAEKTGTQFNLKWLNEPYATLVAMLGGFQGVYVPLQTRILRPESFPKYDLFGVFGTVETEATVKAAIQIEEGRFLTRDLCGSEAEFMTAHRAFDIIKADLTPENIVVGDVLITKEKYPMISAVNRAVKEGTPYGAKYVTLEYAPAVAAKKISKYLFFVGKGITFDTGGLSLKTGGGMKFMANDKCGASAIAGFFKAIALMKPKLLKAKAKLAFVRNGIGAEAYAVDEIIPSQFGIRSRIGSTDAEGRNVMVDLITDSWNEINALPAAEKATAHILTVATLTGHVGLAFGKLTAVLDNGPAKAAKESEKLRNGGDVIADLTEISNLRKEDYEVCYPVSEYEQLQQRNVHPNTVTNRGHQYPAAWMIMASGLYQFSNINSPDNQIKYTHVDVASSVGVHNSEATGNPVTMFLSTYVLPEILLKYNPEPASGNRN